MTRNSTDIETDDEFYDSLDRILSSSNSSASDNDEERRPAVLRRPNRRSHRHLEPLNLWTSAPASVADRRRRLLHLLGLSADPSLSRLHDVTYDGVDVTVGGESGQPSDVAIVGRFGSGDDVMDAGDDVESGQLSNSLAMGRFGCGDDVVKSGDDVTVSGGQLSNPHVTVEIERFGSVDDVTASNNSAAKFKGLQLRSVRFPVADREVDKNLDNGKEFVVGELGEDKVSDKVREVDTGRMDEFEMCVGRSPNMRNVESRTDRRELGKEMMAKRKGVWIRSIKSVLGAMMNHRRRDKRSGDEKDPSLEKGASRLSSATDDSQDGFRGLNYVNSRRVKVRRYGKSQKELTCLVKNQEIQAHDGSIWSMKFSLDGRHLASAGVDRVIHVWEVVHLDQRGSLQNEKILEENSSCNRVGVAVYNNQRETMLELSTTKENLLESQRSKRLHGSRKNVNSEPLMVPEHVFSLSEKPTCSFRGHLDDILDLSWSKSLHLLSSSMDKTVRLWHLSSKTCLKIFSHTHYVTCIQFNPVDDRFFISGSLDEKVRIWSIPDRQIVDWNDLHEMVTAVCYAPDGQSALVGSHKGNCHLYDTSDNKLVQRSQVELGNKKKKSRHKKVTGFQFSPGSSTKVLITSADSRIRVVDGDDLVHKFKGFRNTSSQISAHFTPNGMYLICSSEDDSVYLWRYEDNSQPSRNKGVPSITESYEHFHCEGVTVAIPWSSCTMGELTRTCSTTQNGLDGETQSNLPSQSKTIGQQIPPSSSNLSIDYQQHNVFSPKSPNSNHFNDRVSATWPEELMAANKHITQPTADLLAEGMAAPSRSAWGLVIVTAGSYGQIRIFQNYGLPVGMSDDNSG